MADYESKWRSWNKGGKFTVPCGMKKKSSKKRTKKSKKTKK